MKKILGVGALMLALGTAGIIYSQNNIITTTTLPEGTPVVTEVEDVTVSANATLSADITLSDTEGSVVITNGGTHTLTGTLSDGQVVVDAGDEDITLILNGVDITNDNGSAIYVENAGDVTILLAEGSGNKLTQTGLDGAGEQTGALYSTSDLVIEGESNAELQVVSTVADGISGSDDLDIVNATIGIETADDGVRGKDSVTITGSSVTVDAGGDGIKSTNDEDTERGWVYVADSILSIQADGDGIYAVTDVTVESGSIAITTGNGASGSTSNDTSQKGIKADGDITILGGIVSVDATDDALHTTGSIEVKAGTLTLASGDDGVHADTSITISGGTLTVTKAYEGIESQYITVSGGTVSLTTSDDAFNIANTSGTTNTTTTSMRGGPGGGDQAINGLLTISGGTILVNAQGDGLDSNGSTTMTGGLVIVNGPTNNGNGALDTNGTFTISGGTLIAVGSSGMAEAPDSTSEQLSVLVNLDATQSAGTRVSLVNTDTGEVVMSYTPEKIFQSVVFSSPDLESGASYEFYLDGNATGTDTYNLITSGTLSGGSLLTTLTLSGIVTTYGSQSMMGGPGGGRTRPGSM